MDSHGMRVYRKAVRDRIPEIIEANGGACHTLTLADSDFLVEMEKKLAEEVQEYLESHSPEELADLMDVVTRVAELKGIDADAMDRMRAQKNLEKGAFSRNIFLVDASSQ